MGLQVRAIALVLAMTLAPCAGAVAQTVSTAPAAAPAPPTPQPAPNTVKGVTVTAAAPPVRVSIDRKSYDLTKDIQASTGSLADALRNVPQLSVDLQGNLSIRGDKGVTILVDGKPSTLFSGPGRAQMLQSLPADDYERVEVITNPTAAFAPDGTGGIVNLISKKVRKPGRNGSVRVNVDPLGRWNVGLNASQKTEKLTLTLTAAYRHGLSSIDSTETRVAAAQPGIPAFSSVATSRSAGGQDIWILRTGAEYDPDAATRLSGSVHYYGFDSRSDSDSDTQTSDASGVLQQILDRVGRSDGAGSYSGLDANFRRTFGSLEHDLNVSLVVDRFTSDSNAPFGDLSVLPVLPEAFDDHRSNDITLSTTLKADYERPLPRDGKFKAGYELTIEDDDQSNAGFEGAPTPAGPFDPAEADAFHFDRWINALYATYEQPVAKFTFLAGLRLERTDLRLNDTVADVTATQGYWHLYPTLHLAYQLTPDQQVLASYGERVQRPGASEFDPYRVVQSPFLITAGNPNLKPQETQDFELSWDYTHRQQNLNLGVFYKLNSGGVDNAVTNLGDGVFLYQQENLVSSRSAGGEVSAGGQITKTLSFKLSGTFLWSQIDASTLGLIAPRSLAGATGNGILTWQATPKDTVQLYAWASSRTLDAEGFSTGWEAVSVGYRHKFDDKLSAFLTVQDLFGIARFGSVIDTPALTDRTTDNPHLRAVTLGLSYNFGAGPKRDAPIEIGAPGAGGQ